MNADSKMPTPTEVIATTTRHEACGTTDTSSIWVLESAHVAETGDGVFAAPIAKIPTTGWLGTTSVTPTQIVICRMVLYGEVIEPHNLLPIRVRERGISCVTTARTGTPAVHAITVTAALNSSEDSVREKRFVAARRMIRPTGLH